MSKTHNLLSAIPGHVLWLGNLSEMKDEYKPSVIPEGGNVLVHLDDGTWLAADSVEEVLIKAIEHFNVPLPLEILAREDATTNDKFGG